MLLMNKGATCQGHTPLQWLSQDAAQGVYLPRAHALSTTSHSASEGEPRNQLKITYSPKEAHASHRESQGYREAEENDSTEKGKGPWSWPGRSRCFLAKEETWKCEGAGGQ